MIFGSHITLHTLTVISSLSVYVLTSIVSSHKRNGSNVGMLTDLFCCLETSLDYIKYTFRKPNFLCKFEKQICSTWNSFWGFKDESVATGNSKGEHPQRNHGREVEWSHTCANAQRNPEGISIDSFWNVLEGLSLNDMWDSTSMFNNFKSSLYISHCIRSGFPVLFSNTCC